MSLALFSRFLHWGQGLATCAYLENEDGIWQYAVKILRHLWCCTPCKVRNSCYPQCYQDSYTGDRVWQRAHILRMWMEYAMKS